MIQLNVCDLVITGTWYMPSKSSIKDTFKKKTGAAILIISPKYEKKDTSNIFDKNDIESIILNNKGSNDIPGVSSLITFLQDLDSTPRFQQKWTKSPGRKGKC